MVSVNVREGEEFSIPDQLFTQQDTIEDWTASENATTSSGTKNVQTDSSLYIEEDEIINLGTAGATSSRKKTSRRTLFDSHVPISAKQKFLVKEVIQRGIEGKTTFID